MYYILHATSKNDGNYHCEIKAEHGSVISNPVKVTVIYSNDQLSQSSRFFGVTYSEYPDEKFSKSLALLNKLLKDNGKNFAMHTLIWQLHNCVNCQTASQKNFDLQNNNLRRVGSKITKTLTNTNQIKTF